MDYLIGFLLGGVVGFVIQAINSVHIHRELQECSFKAIVEYQQELHAAKAEIARLKRPV